METTSCYQFGSKIKLFVTIYAFFDKRFRYDCNTIFYYHTPRHSQTHVHMVMHVRDVAWPRAVAHLNALRFYRNFTQNSSKKIENRYLRCFIKGFSARISSLYQVLLAPYVVYYAVSLFTWSNLE